MPHQRFKVNEVLSYDESVFSALTRLRLELAGVRLPLAYQNPTLASLRTPLADVRLAFTSLRPGSAMLTLGSALLIPGSALLIPGSARLIPGSALLIPAFTSVGSDPQPEFWITHERFFESQSRVARSQPCGRYVPLGRRQSPRHRRDRTSNVRGARSRSRRSPLKIRGRLSAG